MADYTPDTPYILGNEWAPIKQTPYLLDSTEEIGTSFSLDLVTAVVSGHAYGVSPDGVPANCWMFNVYPEADLDQAGPIKTTVIQCEAVSATDTGADATVQDQDGGTTNAELAAALASAYDGKYVSSSAIDTGGTTLACYFDVNSHTELTGKRILKLELLYRLEGARGNVDQSVDKYLEGSSTLVKLGVDSGDFLYIAADAQFVTPDTNFAGHPIKALNLGEANFWWNATTSSTMSDWPNPFRDIYPWTYPQLQRFDSSTTPYRLGVTVTMDANGVNEFGIGYTLGYVALRVTYCEEKRVLVGGSSANWAVGVNNTQLRTPSLASVGATLQPGRYVVTVHSVDIGTYSSPFGDQGIGAAVGDMYNNALTELYPMEKQAGKLIVYTSTEGDTHTVSDTSQLVELSLHTTSAAVTGVHPYGTQVAAPVWGTSTNPAKQEIVSSSGASLTRYPYARFYARRMPETTQALTLRHSTYTSAITASITVAEFDELEEILDGWKEVTLTFASPTPSFGNSGSLETYEWVSADSVGGQWQIMSAAAPVITGSFPRVQVTGAQSLDTATYGGPQGANLTWNTVSDTTADATLMFAQEMPAVSGLSVSTASLEVTGIGMECALSPECIPTGISYHAVTWNELLPASIPASGFGYYELQRSDEFDDWQTILQATSPLVTGFHDYEARVGVESYYRIRFQHRLLFPSAWSSTVTSTLPSPGVSGTDVASGVLIFTTNEVQDGSRSLAYAMQWDSEVTEGFNFLEAAETQLQKLYGRDFQVAFRPLERGGSRFQRTLLVQSAAVPTGLIQDGFTSLRDLAWEDVSYICVRDELGDRWLATVLVPDGDVRRTRRLYMANVDIIEVTDTPSTVALPDECTPALWDANPGWDYGCWS